MKDENKSEFTLPGVAIIAGCLLCSFAFVYVVEAAATAIATIVLALASIFGG